MKDDLQTHDAAIAIIGIACRFPDAPSLEDFWRNLCAGNESISRFSDAELLAAGVEPALLANPNYVKAGTLLPEYDGFDASFFGFTPREAELLDPQQRILLETAWESLERAGYSSVTYRGAIGVYVGSGTSYYFLNHLYCNHELMQSAGAYQVFLDNNTDSLAARISYKLNLTGPSVTVQTACSTSLVAVHLACQSLLAGECDMALAGGVALLLPQQQGYLYEEGMILSPDGHCRAFSADAHGTLGGSGVGVVVLKPLAAAIADGDAIHAVIRGSAINNDGSTKVSFAAPSINGQAHVIREAQAVAKVEPETITYVEAHGTGTKLGDPIEIAALAQAFQVQKHGYCALGSVKTNIGHADAAAGVAGLIKTALALEHGTIPPSLHGEQPTSALDQSPFHVNTALTPWKRNGMPRRAGVSSFGIGGTNAHVVLEEAPAREPSGPSRPWQLVLLSAHSEVALENVTRRLAEHLAQHADLNLADVAYTLASGRRRHPCRRMVVCQRLDDATSSLRDVAVDERILTDHNEATQRPVVFMFPGQGAHLAKRGRELYLAEPVFRASIDECAELLLPITGIDFRELFQPAEESLAVATERVDELAIAQPALFVISYALAQLWLSWGVKPKALIGHSLGEYVAATIAGVLSLPEALKLVVLRGRWMLSQPEGAMLAVSLPAEQLALEDGLALAAINGPTMCVVSGLPEVVGAFEQRLTERNVSCRRLHVSRAYHSALMDPILAPLAAHIESLKLRPPQIPYVSTLTGTWITPQEATDPSYWAQHTRQTVQFARGMAELLKEPELILIEVGPGNSLSTLVRQQPGISEQVVLRSLPQPHEKLSESECMLTALGQHWVAGGTVNWAGFYAHERRLRLELPTYPFERQRYWIDPPSRAAAPSPSVHFDPAIKRSMSEWFYVPGWERVPLPRAALPAVAEEGCWLLFVDELCLGTHLAARLRAAGHAVVTVRAGARFAPDGDGAYRIDPQQPEQYSALIETLVRQKKVPRYVLHLWRVTPAVVQETSEEIAAGMVVGFYSLSYLARALGALTSPVQLAVIANHLHSVTGAELLVPEKATLLGPVTVIPQEYPNIHCCCIDLEVGEHVTATMPVVDQVLAEIALRCASADTPSRAMVTPQAPMVAYRGRYRWQQTFSRMPLEIVNEASLGRQPLLREGGVYLITGGLGGVGLILAEYLATFRSKLVLITRSSVPARAHWDDWLATHPDDDAQSHKLRSLKRIEQAGAEVLVLRADVGDEAQMRAALVQAEARFGPLHGVIHAAGLTRGYERFMQALTPADCELHFRAKVYGLLVLQRILDGKPLDFCMLFSSISVLLGGLGFAAYAGANAFMDTFVAAQREVHGIPWMSVNWDGWRLDATDPPVEHLGLQAAFGALPPKPPITSGRGSNLIQMAFTPAEGITLFRTLLAARQRGELEQVVISTVDLHARIRTWVRQEMAAQPAVAASARMSAKRSTQRRYVAPRNEVEQQVAALWQELLGIEEIGISDNFWELGGHSLLATQVIAHIRKIFQIALPMQAIFDEPTVAGLSSYVALTKRFAAGTPAQTSMEDVELEEGVL